MFISQVYLDRKKHDTAKALYNRNMIHGALERCFEGGRQHPLWRIDEYPGRLVLLVISKEIPDFASFVKQFGISEKPVQTKSYDAFLTRGVRQADIMHFHMTVNPVIKKDGKRIPLNMKRTEKQQYCIYDWIRDRLKNHGAELISGDVLAVEKHKISGDQKKITLVTADCDGLLRITDRDVFAEALVRGIGHGKAYGCGMISVMRIKL